MECCKTIETMSRKKSDNKRRFSDDQIKSLENMFECDTKLEPRKKLQVAKELGLHPRQVAIWFQNKRARYKSKKLEKEYSILQAKYDNLATQFDMMKKEKQSLVLQVKLTLFFLYKIILLSEKCFLCSSGHKVKQLRTKIRSQLHLPKIEFMKSD